MPWTGNELAKNCDGYIACGDPDTSITGFAIDSRQVKPGDLFVCLTGKRTDGHKFIEQAWENGAKGFLVHQEILGQRICQVSSPLVIRVQDTLKALQSLGRKHRQKFAVSVVAVTGSVGKTTTKDMIAQVLTSRYKVLKTRGNLNSEISFPLMLLEIDSSHQVAVLEMGMNKQGEIALLAEMARPNVGVVTRIAESHLEKLGSMEKIVEAKSELLENLLPGGTAVLNYDDPRVMGMQNKVPGETLFYGFMGGDVKVTAIENFRGGIRAKVQNRHHTADLELPLMGEHNLSNALAALTVGKIFGIELPTAAESLKKLEISEMRGQFIQLDEITIIDDSYNANVQSTKASLKILHDCEGNRKIAVLGDMYELGAYSEEGHKIIGNEVVYQNIDILVTIGKLSRVINEQAAKSRDADIQAFHVNNNEEALQLLKEIIKPGDVLLVKGSRGMAMENIVKQMMQY